MAIAEGRRVSPRRRGLLLLAVAIVASSALVFASLARGGLDRGVVRLANPCQPRTPLVARGTSGAIEQVVLDGLDGAACRLRVSRERLVVGLASDADRRRLFGSGSVADDRVEEAVRAGLRRAIDDAAKRGQIDGLDLRLLRAAADHLPISELMRGIQAIS
jgi:hypothetical protein